ncbi:Hypothetical predicted protein [Mytilus galloprovincialis]|uniref:WAP domain-containing protein n=1 Tax=Mytilus galloprovincialis TaxID=29158 RepID=A0A8B6E7X7_MYTGA|nr:Hypothetical predicted protein [Mytilus galloprovincialis]
MEGKAVIIFFGFIACAFAVYSPKGGKACEIECSSHSECLDGYKCQTEGCDRMCRPRRVILSNAVVGSDIISAGCVQRCMDRGGLGCRSLCQRSADFLSGGQIIRSGSLDSRFNDALVDSIRSDSLVRHTSSVGDSIRSGSLVRHILPVGDSIRSDSLLGRISSVGDSIRSGSLVRNISPVGDSIRSGSLPGRISQVGSILHKGCQNTCISRGCNFNEECVTRDGCSVCVRAKTYA